jgi:hypothetical protein
MAQKAMTYVTLSGGKTGRYVVRKEQKDGKLLLEPDTSAQAMLKRHGLKRSCPHLADGHARSSSMRPLGTRT